MRHHNVNRKLSRKAGGRRALLRSLAKNLIEKGKMQTTLIRAKEVRPMVEKIVTAGKKGGVSTMRLISSKLASAKSAKKVISEISPKYLERAGGYTRIMRVGRRKSDGAEEAIIEFV